MGLSRDLGNWETLGGANGFTVVVGCSSGDGLETAGWKLQRGFREEIYQSYSGKLEIVAKSHVTIVESFMD